MIFIVLVISLFISFISNAEETVRRYERKSITYFKMKANLPQDIYSKLEREIRGRIEMKRFDYNDVGISGGVSLEDLAKIVRDYVDMVKVDRAKAEAQMDWRYKDLVVTAEDLKRIANSAYIYWPSVEEFKVLEYWGSCLLCLPIVGCIGCFPAISGGEDYIVEAHLKVCVNYWRVRFEDAKIESVAKICEKDIYKTTQNKIGKIPIETKENTRERAIEGVIDFVSRKINASTRKIKDFKLEGPIEYSSFQSAYIPLTKKDGLQKDQIFEVVEYIKGEKGLEEKSIGWIKVSSVADGEKEKQSKFQVISSPTAGFGGGELAKEYPQIGLSTIIESGVQFPKIKQGGEEKQKSSIYIGGGVKFNFPQFFDVGISELYLSPRVSIAIQENFLEYSGELGIEKRYGIRRFFLKGGIFLGYIGVQTSGTDYTEATLSLRPTFGVDFFIHPKISLSLTSFYRLAERISFTTSDIFYDPTNFGFYGGILINF